MNARRLHLVLILSLCALVTAVTWAQTPQTPAAPTTRPCKVTGHLVSGTAPLPGVALTVVNGEKTSAITSSEADGGYSVALAPGTYTFRFSLTGFAPIEKTITLGQPPCDNETNATFTLAPHLAVPAAPPATGAAASTPPAPSTPARGAGAAQGQQGQAQGQGQGQFGGRGQRQAGPPRFQSLTVTQSAAAAADETTVVETTGGRGSEDPAARLLPAGFSLDAPVESIAVNGTMVELDRNLMNERLAALGRGEFGLAEGQFGQPGQLQGVLAGIGGGDQGGRGGGPGGGRGGGAPGLGGRIGGANRLQINANYSLGGSMFDAAPYQLVHVGQTTTAQPARDYTQQSFSGTIGGSLKIPHIYNGTGRTTYNISYNGSHNGDLFDQYATVPSAAFRKGDFSSSSIPIIDPQTGLPFTDNKIPDDRISQAAKTLLNFIPEPTLEGDTRNFRRTGTSLSTTNSISLRFTHVLVAPPTPQRGGGRGGAGGFGGRGGAQGQSSAQTPARGQAGATTPAQATPATGAQTGAATGASTSATTPATGAATSGAASTTPPSQTPAQPPQRNAQAQQGGGRGGRGNPIPRLNATMNVTVNYRRNDGDRLNVFPALNGTTQGSTLSVPATLNIRYGRSMHAISASFNQTKSTTLNNLAFNQNIVAAAGIDGVATDPFDWGVPTISFGSGFTALRDITPSKRTDRSYQLSYTWTRPANKHNFRIGGNYQQSSNLSQSDSNARGSFTFTGLYTANGLATVRGSGQDFADFLLGLPQSASRQFGVSSNGITTPIEIHGRQGSLSFQDDYRWRARWTINYGVQYDVIAPFTEANGRMVNLDANSTFTAVDPVEPGQTSDFNGTFPSGLVKTDWNNVSPRVGAAWRNTNRSVVRFGYGLTYNTGAYSTIARQMTQQPPFFNTGTSLGTLASPLTMADAFLNITANTITNNYGIDEDYVAGLIHQWSVDYGHDLFKTWNWGATYVGTRGSHLDLLRAPNRGPAGLKIPDVQSFTWQSSAGSSHANGLSLRLQKRQTKGVAGTVTYTLSRSWDNTTATGGSATVAQDDQNLASEWALSNFDRRHQVSGNLSVELPWGKNRKWLANGGWLSSLVGDWSMSMNYSWQTGTPVTIRCAQCASDVAKGTSGTLRAELTGIPIQIGDPTIDNSYQFFNAGAFTTPLPGTYGDSPRNVVFGPGSQQLNANFTRDVRLPGNRNVSIQATATNLLNTINYAGLDTNVNSSTFGQITSVRPLRTIRFNLRFRF